MNLPLPLDFLDLKNEERAWIELFGIEDGESVAGHSWSVAFLTSLFVSGRDFDRAKAIEMAVIHDLAEFETGDIIGRNKDSRRNISKEEKHRMEEKAWKSIREKGFEHLYNLWQEYEERNSPEAKVVKDMDLLDLCLQATKYQKQSRYSQKKLSELPEEFLDEVFSNSKTSLQTELGEEMFSRVKSNYERAKKGEKLDWEDERLSLAYQALDLKDENRTGWELREVENPETVAAHSWGSALQVILNSADEFEKYFRVLTMAIVHDLEQASVGGIPSRGDEERKVMSTGEKTRTETESMQELVPGNLEFVLNLWNGHMELESSKARFVEDMEQIDMVLQALKYEKDERYDPKDNTDFSRYEAMDEFFASANQNIQTSTGRTLFKKIKQEYEKVKTG